MQLTIFGLGEAGSLIAADLVSAGVVTTAYDPAGVTTPQGVTRYADPPAAVAGADGIISLTASVDAMIAINQALDQIPPAAFYADFSTSSATVKRALATVAATRSIPFIDVALMGTVPGKGLRTPALASGPGAGHFVELFTGMGMPVVKVSDVPGDAATRKLLRSIVMKGMAGAIIEAMRGAEKAGCADWLWDNLAAEISRADAALLSRLVRGTELHAERRKHEMEASMNLLIDLGIEPLMTRSTIENLRRIPDEGMPAIPVLPD